MDTTLIPVAGDFAVAHWQPADPTALGLQAEAVLVHLADSAYRPIITISRHAADEVGDLAAVADATVADAGADASVLGREAGDDFVSQLVQFTAEGHDLRLTEVALRWSATHPALTDTVVVARLTCLPDQLPAAGADFEALVSTLAPAADA